jgi:hypothetical protein
MAAEAWTLVDLLATTVVVLAWVYLWLDSKIEAYDRHLGARIDAQGRDLGARIDAHLERRAPPV